MTPLKNYPKERILRPTRVASRLKLSPRLLRGSIPVWLLPSHLQETCKGLLRALQNNRCRREAAPGGLARARVAVRGDISMLSPKYRPLERVIALFKGQLRGAGFSFSSGINRVGLKLRGALELKDRVPGYYRMNLNQRLVLLSSKPSKTFRFDQFSRKSQRSLAMYLKAPLINKRSKAATE